MSAFYFATLAATILVECAIAARLLWRKRPGRWFPFVLCANLVTHPIASHLIHNPWRTLGFWPTEVLVIAAEFGIYRYFAGFDTRLAALLALATNGCTIALSLLLF